MDGTTVFIRAPKDLLAFQQHAAIISAGILSGPVSAGFMDREAAALGIMKLQTGKLAEVSAEIALEIESAAEAAWNRRREEIAKNLSRI